MTAQKVGRNDNCNCGSGRKYKQCCAGKSDKMSPSSLVATVITVGAIAIAVVYALTTAQGSGSRQVWDPDHGHYHTVP